jgi:hypothetical protein
MTADEAAAAAEVVIEPAATPAPAPAPAADAPARIAEIEHVLRTDIDRYEREHMSDELLALKRAEAAEGLVLDEGEEEGDAEAADDEGDPAEIEPADDGDRLPWQRPAGLEGDALAAWKEQQGLPVSPDEYEIDLDLQEGQQISEVGQELLDGLKSLAVEADMLPGQPEKVAKWYQAFLTGQQARLAEAERAAKADLVTDLKADLGDRFASFKTELDTAFKGLPPDLRAALKTARTADGLPLMVRADVVRLIHGLGQGQGQDSPQLQPQDSRTAMQAELQALDQMMLTDIGAYNRRGYRGRDISASDRKLEILREMEAPKAKPSVASLRGEEAELKALAASDPQVFEYSPTWKGTGKTAAQRLYELQTGRG